MPNAGYAQFSIEPLGGTKNTYGDLTQLGTRSALYSSSGTPEYEYSVWHIPGTDGNVVCNLGENGRTVILTAVYIGTYPDILTTYENDKVAYAGVPCTVIDCAGKTHSRSRLKGTREAAPPKGTTNSGSNVAFFTVQFSFEVQGTTT